MTHRSNWPLLCVALLAVGCAPQVGKELFACKTSEDCASGRECKAGFCRGRANDGTCLPTACEFEGRACGALSDGCGRMLDCGTCQAPSGGSASCDNGTCRSTCNQGFVFCGGACVMESEQACGASCQRCASPTGMGGARCVAGQCETFCDPGLAKCEASGATVCRAQSPTACGASCQSCPVPDGGVAMCANGSCGFTCSPGFLLCNGGCVPCAAPAGGSARCSATAQCEQVCPAGQFVCGGSCVTPSVAACGASCASCAAPTNGGTPTCVSGGDGGVGCSGTCPGSRVLCGSPGALQCTTESATACGAGCRQCPVPANATAICSSGSCDFTCQAGFTKCGSACIDLNTDTANCGACGYPALGGRTCVSGKPTPAWVSIPAAPSATGSQAAFWSGRRLVHLELNRTVRFFDPVTSQWSTTALQHPFDHPTMAGTFRSLRILSLGSNQTLLVSARGPFTAQLFIDQNTPQFVDVTPTNPDIGAVFTEGGSITPLGSTLARNGNNAIAVTAGRSFSVVTFDTNSRTWSTSGVPFNPSCGTAPLSSVRATVLNGQLLVHFVCSNMNISNACSAGNQFATNFVVRGPLDGSSWNGQSIANPARVASAFSDSPTWLNVGNGVVGFGGVDACATCSSRLPTFSDASLHFLESGSGPYAQQPFAAFTGQAALIYGGAFVSPPCGAAATFMEQGFVGRQRTGDSPAWVVMPSVGAPAAGALATQFNADTQYLWSGVEALFYGANRFGQSPAGSGRYQPPVGCVCDGLSSNPFSPVCQSITGAVPACSP